MTAIDPKAFLAIENGMTKALTHGWAQAVAGTVPELRRLLEKGKWAAADQLIDTLNFNGIVDYARERLEELAVSALLFGAHHVHGDVAATSYIAGKKALPAGIQQALGQLDISLKYNAAEYARAALHALVANLEQQQKVKLYKAEDWLGNPELHKRSLYVSRPLVNSAQLIAWAKAQGFPSVIDQADLHVTVCHSKTPLDWQSTQVDEPQVIAVGGERAVKRFGKAAVLTFESAELQRRHDTFREAGASFDYPSYIPHITITYAGGDLDLSSVEPYTGELILGPEEFATVDDGWSGNVSEQALAKADAELSLADRLNQAVLEGKALIDVNASLTTSRLISLGFLSECTVSAITTYQISEVLDSRTCAVCAFMHGKTFEVATEYSKLMTVLGTTDPSELRSLAPWPSNSKASLEALASMSEAQLQSNGYGSPPFHPNCRGMLVKVGTVTNITTTQVVDQAALQGVIDAASAPAATVEAAPASAINVTEGAAPAFGANLDPGAEDVVANGFEMSKTVPIARSHSKLPGLVDENSSLDLLAYTGTAYNDVNRYLRGVQEPSEMVLSIVGTLDGMMKPAALDLITYRGIFQSSLADGFQVGDVIESAAYTSTSRSASVAADFSAGATNPVLFKLNVPAGSPVIITNAGESEVILDRGARFKVSSIIDVPPDAPMKGIKRLITLDVLPADAAKGGTVLKKSETGHVGSASRFADDFISKVTRDPAVAALEAQIERMGDPQKREKALAALTVGDRATVRSILQGAGIVLTDNV